MKERHIHPFDAFVGTRGAAFVYRRRDGRVLDANAALGETWGYGRGEFLGEPDRLYGLWANPRDWLEHGRRLNDTGSCLGLATRLRKADGTVVNAYVTSVLSEDCGTPVVLMYLLPRSATQHGPVHPDDERRLGPLLYGSQEATSDPFELSDRRVPRAGSR